MNKRGLVFLYTLMLGTTIIILALALAQPSKEFVDSARNSEQLNCSLTNLTQWEEGTCLELDLLKPWFVGGLLIIGFLVIGAKVIVGG